MRTHPVLGAWLLGGLLLLSACAGPAAVPTAAPTAPPAPRDTLRPTAVPPTLRCTARPTARPTAAPTVTPTPAPYGAAARAHLAALAEGIGRREAGSAEEETARRYVEAAFAAYGYGTELQRFTFYYWDDSERESANVIAVKPGASAREIIVGAHYDSTGPGQGADDNASGVAVMLEAAGRLRDVPTPYTIRFIAFGAEEVDLDGSHYFVAQMDRAAIANTVGMINLDSLVAGEIPYIYGDAGPGTLRDWLVARAAELGLTVDTRKAWELDEADGTPCDCADYDAFQEAGIPFAYFEANNWNVAEEEWAVWHTRNDTLAYLDGARPGRVDRNLAVFTRLLYEVLTGYR